MQIFDFHTHIGAWHNELYTKFDVSLSDLVLSMAILPVTGSVVMPSDLKQNESLSVHLRELKTRNLFFFPWVNPLEPGILDFLEKNTSQIRGLKFSASYDRITGVTDPLYVPFVEFAQQFALPVLVHCGRWQEMAGYLYALKLARKWPTLKIICAHMGGIRQDLQWAAQDLVKEWNLENVWFDTSAVFDPDSILRGIHLLGSHRFLFGSDYPLYCLDESVNVIMGLNCRELIKEQILYKNAGAILDFNGIA